MPDQLSAALADLSEPDLDLCREEGKWNIRQIVHHIVDADDLAKTIIKAALGNSGCIFDQTWYDMNNTFAETLAYANRAIEPALALFRANHHHIEHLLKHLPDAWERFVMLKYAKVPEGRKITVGYLIQAQTWHAQHHIEQIRATREAHGL
jgi:hypothetical protein